MAVVWVLKCLEAVTQHCGTCTASFLRVYWEQRQLLGAFHVGGGKTAPGNEVVPEPSGDCSAHLCAWSGTSSKDQLGDRVEEASLAGSTV